MFWKGINDSSSGGKFWQIAVSGSDTVVTFGKINTDGRKSTKSHETENDAIEYVKKQIKTKQKKGYTEEITDSQSD
uniref:WGR domain-containing protein n=1 Tax=viral metagenome TaxID=1070528 RepID=A0A6C0J6M6_9ZZZZ